MPAPRGKPSPPQLPDYGSVDYWDARYMDAGNRASFEWFFHYKDIAVAFEAYLRRDKSEKILVLGCGTSSLPNDLVKAGYDKITCVDFSGAAIRSMTSRLPTNSPIQYFQMDVRDMHAFSDHTFDLIIDKGVLDCVVCDVSNAVGATRMMDEVRRLLQPSGSFFVFSTGTLSNRAPYLKSSYWQMTQVALGQPVHVLALMLRPQGLTTPSAK
ncbi:unnamed protein product [Aphanomyces euteiches]|uniref:Methyltransferase type 11 domain-containing protein n=1 Tax=Aphanomyces euteiches TaxID=100861 RepID=A0A6G0X8R2_9STRA|nr:hypothetical protein Ae201684_007439 [Aphanomyces euteiches]KAH9100767.1 hypothetical protein Ae201684P_006961 [Aphanomyces euteiches]KAH9155085.1 hypothetical protein AeRB84_002918 [Aphanomyces euteiches]